MPLSRRLLLRRLRLMRDVLASDVTFLRPHACCSSKHASRHYLKRVLEQFDMEPSRELFAELARNASVDALRHKCPKNFQRFYNDVQRFA